MKRILIISYYWPPSGGSGVQRWLYFTKHLRRFGWEPVIFTVANGEYPYIDPGLEKQIPEGVEVIRSKIWEPYTLFKKVSGTKGQVNPTIFSEMEQGTWYKKLLLWIRGNLFIPDARMFWIRPAIHQLTDYLKLHPVDCLVSTGPPHSTHLIARALKRKLNIKWLADFRDPWTQIYSFKQLNLGSLSRNIHHRLEASVLAEADLIVTVSPDCQKGLESLSGRKVEVITNGYEEFEKKIELKKDAKIRMLYAGVLSGDRDPVKFWEVLETYLNQNPDLQNQFELILIGNIDPQIIKKLSSSGLKDQLVYFPSMPHEQLQSHLCQADILLLIGVPGNKGVVTGKFFEYLYLQKPILSIAPQDGDVELLLNKTKAGFNADYEDVSKIEWNLKTIIEMVRRQNFNPDLQEIENYSRKNLTGNLVKLLEENLT